MSSSTLDIEQPAQLLGYLCRTGRLPPEAGNAESPIIDIAVLAGGVSNRTVRVGLANGDAWVIKQALPQLRVAAEWFSDPQRVHREALALRWLAQLLPPDSVPALVFEDHEEHLLAMTAVPQPHQNWKTRLLAGTLEQGLVEQFAALLAALHRESYRRREALAREDFADRRFFESLRLEPYYSYTASQVPDAAVFIDTLLAATRAESLCLVHGDYSPKNTLVYRDRLVLLDFEVAHWGDPGFDLGFALTHLLSKAHHLPQQRAAFAAAAGQFWQTYETLLDGVLPCPGPMLQARAVRHTLACLLARVAGRSPLEYLNPAEQRRQRDAVLRLLPAPPLTVAALLERWTNELG